MTNMGISVTFSLSFSDSSYVDSLRLFILCQTLTSWTEPTYHNRDPHLGCIHVDVYTRALSDTRKITHSRLAQV